MTAGLRPAAFALFSTIVNLSDEVKSRPVCASPLPAWTNVHCSESLAAAATGALACSARLPLHDCAPRQLIPEAATQGAITMPNNDALIA